ncbi:glycine--tRNA ligase subunit beta [Aquisediminimonas profunda]|uniref:glycine--tRNA ligase subunit beta n=1 Tax=Aquisediminimonas profunda TaxID=1550733 RepID=UPI001C62DF25|nr:glycine--tRNA ligase subunit beta [Aquisediminimonas profunda]
MTDFLLELRSEEIPARMQDKARADLARLFAEEIGKAGLQATEIVTYATPRRLALIARGLPLETSAVSEELKGPKTSAPPQALEGFLRKTGLTQDQLEDRDGTWFAVIAKPGRQTADVLAEAIPTIVRAFPWPKSMRWGAASASTESLRWVRPLQGIVALLGDTVVPFEIDGVASGSATVGHRFHHSGDVTIGNAADYAAKLNACHVIVDQEERRAIIRSGAEKAAAAAGLTLVPDEGLVIENAGLTEWPVPMLGRFDPAFLAVPEEVIQLTARVNQKYFICRDDARKLANAFVCTANINANDGGAAIVAGNEKVLAARLSDAKFFWEQDLKVPLETQAEKLKDIVFHEKLGTVADKVERVAKLARWLVEEGIVKGASANDAERAALLCKADLVTGMVGEFPELQGIMGGYYARAQGETDAVADAVRDHYKPVGQGDDVPTAPVTVAVSLADKLDTLVGFFAEDMLPTGSKDPFALRRAMLALVQLVLSNNLRFDAKGAWFEGRSEYIEQIRTKATADLWPKIFADHERAIDLAAELAAVEKAPVLHISAIWKEMEQQPSLQITQDQARDIASAYVARETQLLYGASVPVYEELSKFLADRLKVQQREAGVRHDLIDAVFALGGEDDLVRLLARVKALQAFVTTEEGTNLLAGYKRAANILKQAEGVAPAEAGASAGVGSQGVQQVPAFAGATEFDVALLNALEASEPKATAAIEAEDFEGAMAALATLRAPIDAFFDGVMVNDPDPQKRAFRLGLLARFRDAVHRVADFSKIEG